MWKLVFIILALLYALNPYDLFPDMIVGWGWLDDLIILGLLGRYLYNLKKKVESSQKYFGRGEQSSRNTHGNYTRNDHTSGTKSEFGETSMPWDPYKILEINRNASPEEIKRAYRRLANKYHPDKVEHLGDEFKLLAEKRFKEIQKAYQELRTK